MTYLKEKIDQIETALCHGEIHWKSLFRIFPAMRLSGGMSIHSSFCGKWLSFI